MRTRSLALLAGLAAVSTAMVAPPRPARPPAGTIDGTVTYTGTPPKMKPIDMSKEPACVTAHATPAMTENVVTGPASTLRWVVVYVSAGDRASPPPAEPARYDQKDCQYLPHVLALQVN